MAAKKEENGKKVVSRGAWTAEEDRKLAHYIEANGARRWKTVALNAGLSRCGKSCRLRWLNYLRPNIKRGNISDEEEDLILRLHKLLGNRWSLIAGRLPGRTDNEIKNYWNSHLKKKIAQKDKKTEISTVSVTESYPDCNIKETENNDKVTENRDVESNFDVAEFYHFPKEETYGLDYVTTFLELDEEPNWLNERRGEYV